MPDYTKLPIGDRAPQLVNAVIEIPKDSVNKYEYDKQLHVFRLDRTLFSPVHYPGDYGFLPCTLGNEGDRRAANGGPGQEGRKNSGRGRERSAVSRGEGLF